MNLNFHIHESHIKCPYCNEECRDDDHEVSRELETKVEFECEHCGKKFQAESCIVFNTQADCALNNEEHDLKETHIKGFFQCENCDHYEDKR